MRKKCYQALNLQPTLLSIRQKKLQLSLSLSLSKMVMNLEFFAIVNFDLKTFLSVFVELFRQTLAILRFDRLSYQEQKYENYDRLHNTIKIAQYFGMLRYSINLPKGQFLKRYQARKIIENRPIFQTVLVHLYYITAGQCQDKLAYCFILATITGSRWTTALLSKGRSISQKVHTEWQGAFDDF